MYHKIDIVTPSRWWVTPERFAEQIRYLRRHYKFVCLDEYELTSERQVVVTFDDGYENVYRHGFPLLKKLSIPFEIFINGDFLADWNEFDKSEMLTRFCNLGHLLEMSAFGGRIQWHTRNHSQLPSLSDEEMDIQLTVNERLKSTFHAPHLQWFAYPSGMHDDRSESAVRRMGFVGALSVDDGSATNRFALNRVTVDEMWNPSDPSVHSSEQHYLVAAQDKACADDGPRLGLK